MFEIILGQESLIGYLGPLAANARSSFSGQRSQSTIWKVALRPSFVGPSARKVSAPDTLCLYHAPTVIRAFVFNVGRVSMSIKNLVKTQIDLMTEYNLFLREYLNRTKAQ